MKREIDEFVIDLIPRNKQIMKNVFEITINFHQGEKGELTNKIVCTNKKELLAYKILLDAGYEYEECEGYLFRDIVNKFKKYVTVNKEKSAKKACIEFFKNTFEELKDVNGELEMEGAITDFCVDKNIIIRNGESHGWDFARQKDYKIVFYDELGKEFLVANLVTSWEKLNKLKDLTKNEFPENYSEIC